MSTYPKLPAEVHFENDLLVASIYVEPSQNYCSRDRNGRKTRIWRNLFGYAPSAWFRTPDEQLGRHSTVPSPDRPQKRG